METKKNTMLLRALLIIISLVVSMIGTRFLPKIWLLIVPIVAGIAGSMYISHTLGMLFRMKYTDSIVTKKQKENINVAFVISLSFIGFPLAELMARIVIG